MRVGALSKELSPFCLLRSVHLEPQFVDSMPVIPAFGGSGPVECPVEEAFISIHQLPQPLINEMITVLVVEGSDELLLTIVLSQEPEKIRITNLH